MALVSKSVAWQVARNSIVIRILDPFSQSYCVEWCFFLAAEGNGLFTLDCTMNREDARATLSMHTSTEVHAQTALCFVHRAFLEVEFPQALEKLWFRFLHYIACACSLYHSTVANGVQIFDGSKYDGSMTYYDTGTAVDL